MIQNLDPRVMRGHETGEPRSMALYQTSDSNLSAKQSELPMIFCSRAFSSGSRC